MDTLWLLYDDPDMETNRGFVSLMCEHAAKRGILLEPVRMSELCLGMDENGTPICLRNGSPAYPRAVLSRQRLSRVSVHFERMGVPVFNNARVCSLCNDKRNTHLFLQSLPMPHTVFLSDDQTEPPVGTRFPVVLKPACSHGGDRVTLVNDADAWRKALARIRPDPAIQQAVVSGAGRDLRVYVVHGLSVAGVMRTAAEGIVSNFKRGGHVALHNITPEERDLAQAVIRRFAQAGAPLCLAGVDLLYDKGRPVIGEVEDVVGSRMLYQVSDIDIVSLFWDGLSQLLTKPE